MDSKQIKDLENKLQDIQQKIDEQRNRVTNVTNIALNMAAQMKVSGADVDYDRVLHDAGEVYDEICVRVDRHTVPSAQIRIDRLVEEGEDVAEALRKARHIESMIAKPPKKIITN